MCKCHEEAFDCVQGRLCPARNPPILTDTVEPDRIDDGLDLSRGVVNGLLMGATLLVVIAAVLVVLWPR